MTYIHFNYCIKKATSFNSIYRQDSPIRLLSFYLPSFKPHHSNMLSAMFWRDFTRYFLRIRLSAIHRLWSNDICIDEFICAIMLTCDDVNNQARTLKFWILANHTKGSYHMDLFKNRRDDSNQFLEFWLRSLGMTPLSITYAIMPPSIMYATTPPSITYATMPPSISYATMPPSITDATMAPSITYATVNNNYNKIHNRCDLDHFWTLLYCPSSLYLKYIR